MSICVEVIVWLQMRIYNSHIVIIEFLLKNYYFSVDQLILLLVLIGLK
jgi:hypothetical protein